MTLAWCWQALQDLALLLVLTPPAAVPCRIPVAHCFEDTLCHGTDRKWAPQTGCNPGTVWGRGTGDIKGPFPGGRIG